MAMRLNMHESSLKKKRGISFFVDNRKQDFDLLNIESKPHQIIIENIDNCRRSNANISTDDHHKLEPETAIDTSYLFDNRQLESAAINQKNSPFEHGNQIQILSKHMMKTSTDKDIRSAMVKLNTQGLNVPVQFEELKKLPNISQPGTAARIQKKNFTDLGPGSNILNLTEANEDEEVSQRHSQQRIFKNRHQSVSRSKYNSTHQSNTLDEDTTTIFDLVHRDRQRQQEQKAIQKFSNENRQVHSPKILSPMCMNQRNNYLQYDSSGLNSGIIQNASQNFLLGRKHLANNNYRSISGTQKHKHYSRSKDKKKALRELNKEIQSAVLPDIGSGISCKKSRSLNFKGNKSSSNERQHLQIKMDDCSNINLQNNKKKQYEYIHEVQGKWTIFNKHVIEIEPEQTTNQNSARACACKEDSIIENLISQDHSAIPHQIWSKLYEAKCMDLGLPCKSDKQAERFITQMTLTQRPDKLSFKDQGMSYQSANIIGKNLIGANDSLTKIDLSCNQFQSNFKPIVNGIKRNKRIVQLIMKNNQLSGAEHADDLKAIVKNHPTLFSIDFSNHEVNVNKNKLRNVGAIAIVEGILESTAIGYSLISEINLSYNYLTADCLPYFSLLNDPHFVQIQYLNLSYNALGPDSIKILGPMMSSLFSLNLSNTKLNNQSISDFVQLYKQQKMELREFDLHSNQVTAEGFHELLSCLETNNKVAKIWIAKNPISNDCDSFKIIHHFLSCNKTLELLDLSFCELNEKHAAHIGKGLRGNRYLQTLNLKGNPIKNGVIEIAKAFKQNKVALCLKDLDISKCQLTCQHITSDFLEMIKSPFTTLQSLIMRDNLIKFRGSQLLMEALEDNKTITRLQIDYNPVKQEVAEQIEKICLRNKDLDQINQKNKNLYELMQKKMKAKTQRQSLKREIEDLKQQTDKSILEAQLKLAEIEKQQQCRKSSKSFFVTLVPHQNSNPITNASSQYDVTSKELNQNQYQHDLSSSMLALPNGQLCVKEPYTAVTKGSVFTFGLSNHTNPSLVQHLRHQSQGPMRSEKVYMMTQLINQKLEQLAGEKHLVKERFKHIDNDVSEMKEVINKDYLARVNHRDQQEVQLKQQDDQIQQLDQEEIALKAKFEKMISDIQDRIKVVKLGQEKTSAELKQTRLDLNQENKKYDRYLERDKERLVYANNMLKTRKLVHLSYANEIKRREDKKLFGPKAEEVSEAMALAQAELKRMEGLDFKGSRKKATSNDAIKRKSFQKKTSQPYQNVKSRLYKSIESSRQKETKKFENIERMKFIEYKDQNSHKKNLSQRSGNASQFMSQSKYQGVLETGGSEQQSILNSYRKVSTFVKPEKCDFDITKGQMVTTDKKSPRNSSTQQFKKHLSGVKPKFGNEMEEHNARKTVVFKQSHKHIEAPKEKDRSQTIGNIDASAQIAVQNQKTFGVIGDGIGGVDQIGEADDGIEAISEDKSDNLKEKDSEDGGACDHQGEDTLQEESANANTQSSFEQRMVTGILKKK